MKMCGISHFFEILGIVTFGVMIVYILHTIYCVVKHIISRKKSHSAAVKLISTEIPSFIARFHFFTNHKLMLKGERILQFFFPQWYMGHLAHRISIHFRGGYCWYFAHMLQLAFHRGTVCWACPCSHFVWMDEDNVCWDIQGRVCKDEYSFFIPESYLPEDMLFIFQQTNYRGHDIGKYTLDQFMSIVHKYAQDHNLEFNEDFVSEMINDYIIGECSKNRRDIKEKTAAHPAS